MAEFEGFHDDMLLEILTRLPVRTCTQLKLTCKSWERLISEPLFVATQTQRSTRDVAGILSATACPSGGSLYYWPLDQHGRAPCEEAPDTSLGLPEPQRISLRAACGGLLFFKLGDGDGYVLCNPTTKSLRQLPYLDNANSSWDTAFGLAFDPDISPATFRVVACVRSLALGVYRFFVCSHAAADEWRVSECTVRCTYEGLLGTVTSVFYDGALHWLRDGDDRLLAFNVEEERAYGVALPQGVRPVRIPGGYASTWLGVAAGRMRLMSLVGGDILVWVVEDYGRGRWKLEHRIRAGEPPGCCRPSMAAPIFYDGRRCVFLTLESPERESGLSVYRIETGRWDDQLRSLERWMDRCRHFVPYISNTCWGS